MRRIRNPRYAPEFLERRLSPSGLPSNPPAEVGYVESDGGSLSAIPNSDGPSAAGDPGDPPPIDPVPPPADPSGPANSGDPGDPPPIDPVPPPADPSGPA